MSKLVGAAIVAALGCRGTSDPPTPPVTPTPVAVAPPADAAAANACDLVVSGAFDIDRHAFIDREVTDVYVARWRAKPDLGRAVFVIQCGVQREVSLSIVAARNTRVDQIDLHPGDYPIATYPDPATAKPGEIVAWLDQGASHVIYNATSGRLHITRVERGLLDATWDLQAAKAGDTIHVTGSITYRE